MILILKKNASQEDLERLVEKLHWMGFVARPSGEEGHFTIALVKGVDDLTDVTQIKRLPLIEEVTEFKHPFKLAAREFKPQKTVIDIRGVKIGGGTLAVMASPCAIESKEQIFECAKIIAGEGVKILRGGAFKPRTSPYSFQGL